MPDVRCVNRTIEAFKKYTNHAENAHNCARHGDDNACKRADKYVKEYFAFERAMKEACK